MIAASISFNKIPTLICSNYLFLFDFLQYYQNIKNCLFIFFFISEEILEKYLNY